MKKFYYKKKVLILAVLAFLGTVQAQSQWQTVGSAGASPGSVYNLCFAFSPLSNEPYVVYKDEENDWKAVIRKYNGTSWVNVGVTPGVVDPLSFVFDPNMGVPLLGVSDGGKATVMRFLEYNSTWDTVGVAQFSEGAVGGSLALATHGSEYYVAFRDNANINKTTVMGFTGGKWDVLGAAGFSTGQSALHSLAIHPTSGIVYSVYADQTNWKTCKVF